MNKKYLYLLLITIILISCEIYEAGTIVVSPPENQPVEPDVIYTVKDVLINTPKTNHFYPKKVSQLSSIVVYEPSKANEGIEVYWSVDNPNLASIDTNGELRISPNAVFGDSIVVKAIPIEDTNRSITIPLLIDGFEGTIWKQRDLDDDFDINHDGAGFNERIDNYSGIGHITFDYEGRCDMIIETDSQDHYLNSVYYDFRNDNNNPEQENITFLSPNISHTNSATLKSYDELEIIYEISPDNFIQLYFIYEGQN